MRSRTTNGGSFNQWLGQSTHMKKWGVILAVAAIAIFEAVELAHDGVASDPIGYFSREPSRWLYVAGIAITGGLLTLGYSKLPLRPRRLVKMFSLGAAASIATGVFGYFVFILYSLASVVPEHGGSAWAVLLKILPVLLLLSAFAASCWFRCWRVWKTEISQ